MAFASAARLAVAVVGVQWVREVSAHGKLTSPASRNEIDGNGGCAHCLNAAGPCGDGSSGKFLNFFAGSQATWTAGSVVPITIAVTAHHRGHYEFRVCDQVLNGGVADPDACLDKWLLERATPEEAGFTDCAPGDQRPGCVPFDPQHPERWYLPPSTEVAGTHTIYFKVPAGLQCEVCTLQWHWWSANSCIPASDYGCYKDVLQSKGYWVGETKLAWWTAGSGSCPGGCGSNVYCGCGEQFWNCADITVLPSSSGPGTTTMTTTAQASTSMQTTTAPATTRAPSAGCKAASGAEQYGATDSRCTAVCQMLPDGQWPCGPGNACDCSGTSTTTATTTATTSATTTATTMPATSTVPSTTAGGGRVCTPTPGLPPNGATLANCAQCAAGYQWWPCNTDPAICTCSGSSLAEVSHHDASAARHSRRQGFLGTSLLQDGAVTAHSGAGLSETGDEL